MTRLSRHPMFHVGLADGERGDSFNAQYWQASQPYRLGHRQGCANRRAREEAARYFVTEDAPLLYSASVEGEYETTVVATGLADDLEDLRAAMSVGQTLWRAEVVDTSSR